MTLKQKIMTLLEPLGYPIAYGYTPKGSPVIRYTNVSNNTSRLSNQKANRVIFYQIDVFSQIPLDLEEEGEGILYEIESVLENNGLYTTDWMENIIDETLENFSMYHYFLTVRK